MHTSAESLQQRRLHEDMQVQLSIVGERSQRDTVADDNVRKIGHIKKE